MLMLVYVYASLIVCDLCGSYYAFAGYSTVYVCCMCMLAAVIMLYHSVCYLNSQGGFNGKERFCE